VRPGLIPRKVIGVLLNNFVESYNQQMKVEVVTGRVKRSRIFKVWKSLPKSHKKPKEKLPSDKIGIRKSNLMQTNTKPKSVPNFSDRKEQKNSTPAKQSSTRTTAKKTMKNQGQKFPSPKVLDAMFEIDQEYATEMNDFVRVSILGLIYSLNASAGLSNVGSLFLLIHERVINFNYSLKETI